MTQKVHKQIGTNKTCVCMYLIRNINVPWSWFCIWWKFAGGYVILCTCCTADRPEDPDNVMSVRYCCWASVLPVLFELVLPVVQPVSVVVGAPPRKRVPTESPHSGVKLTRSAPWQMGHSIMAHGCRHPPHDLADLSVVRWDDDWVNVVDFVVVGLWEAVHVSTWGENWIWLARPSSTQELLGVDCARLSAGGPSDPQLSTNCGCGGGIRCISRICPGGRVGVAGLITTLGCWICVPWVFGGPWEVILSKFALVVQGAEHWPTLLFNTTSYTYTFIANWLAAINKNYWYLRLVVGSYHYFLVERVRLDLMQQGRYDLRVVVLVCLQGQLAQSVVLAVLLDDRDNTWVAGPLSRWRIGASPELCHLHSRRLMSPAFRSNGRSSFVMMHYALCM